ncbi:MAG: flagellar M-ring protein FliF [Nitrospirae bacterium]|nr:flagellar M-ring protein FliF [Nitrospirota bacterium]
MFERLQQLGKQLFERFIKLPRPYQILVGAGAAVLLLTITVLSARKPVVDYQLLYGNLQQEELAKIKADLDEQLIPYKISADETAISVPKGKAMDLRLSFSLKGMPTAGIGYEIFDQKAFGLTEFQQRINLLRALQGELERTISKMGEIQRARVHLSMPEKSLFIGEEKKTSASVMLLLKPGMELKRHQVKGIVHLVSSSIEGLQNKDVTIVDNHGRILTEGLDEGSDGGITSTQIERQQWLEKEYEKKIVSILEPVVGPQRVVAKVTAELDWTRTEQKKEDWDPNRIATRSEQSVTEKFQGGAQVPVGIPGVRSNIPPDLIPPGVQPSEQKYTKEQIATNYEVTKTVTMSQLPTGDVARLTVAVLVDGKYQMVKEGGRDVRKFVARTGEELLTYEALVRNSVGYRAERGDEVKVASFPLAAVSSMEDEMRLLRQREREEMLIRYSLIGLSIVAFAVLFLLGMRYLNRWLEAKREAELAALGEEELEEKPIGPPEIRLEAGAYLKRALEFARKDPRMAAEILRQWLKK